MAALGLRCFARAFSSCGKQGLLIVGVRGLLIAGALGAWASVVAACGLSSCGSWVLLLHDMWDLPGPGLEPMSPALASGF